MVSEAAFIEILRDILDGDRDRCGFRKYRTAISLIPGQPFQ